MNDHANETGIKLTRRDLLFKPFQKIKQSLSDIRSENSKTEDEILRDNVVEKVGEGIAIAAIAMTALKGSRDQIVTYRVDSESKQQD